MPPAYPAPGGIVASSESQLAFISLSWVRRLRVRSRRLAPARGFLTMPPGSSNQGGTSRVGLRGREPVQRDISTRGDAAFIAVNDGDAFGLMRCSVDVGAVSGRGACCRSVRLRRGSTAPVRPGDDP